MTVYKITLPDGRTVQVGAETFDEAQWLAPAVADLHQRELARVYGQEAS